MKATLINLTALVISPFCSPASVTGDYSSSDLLPFLQPPLPKRIPSTTSRPAPSLISDKIKPDSFLFEHNGLHSPVCSWQLGSPRASHLYQHTPISSLKAQTRNNAMADWPHPSPYTYVYLDVAMWLASRHEVWESIRVVQLLLLCLSHHYHENLLKLAINIFDQMRARGWQMCQPQLATDTRTHCVPMGLNST